MLERVGLAGLSPSTLDVRVRARNLPARVEGVIFAYVSADVRVEGDLAARDRRVLDVSLEELARALRPGVVDQRLFFVAHDDGLIRRIGATGELAVLAGDDGVYGVRLGVLPAAVGLASHLALDPAGMLYLRAEQAVLALPTGR